MADRLGSSIQYVRGVGPARAKALGKLGICSVESLLTFYPSRYEDRRQVVGLGELVAGETQTLYGQVMAVEERRVKGNMVITRIGVGTGDGVVWGIYFNRPYLAREFVPGGQVFLTGKAERFGREWRILNPDYETVDGDDPIHSGRIVPVYPLTAGITSRFLRQTVYLALENYRADFPESLPEEIRTRQGLLGKEVAMGQIHFPQSQEALAQARKRLVFEELFQFQLGLARRRLQRGEEAGVAHCVNGPLLKAYRKNLPFVFTKEQEKVWAEIEADMESKRPMNRLLHGEVGTGKTVIAAAALVKAAEGRYQGVLLAPTEVLAEQHAWNLGRYLGSLGLEVGLLTGGTKGRKEILAALREGALQVAVGTQALLSEEVVFANLGLVIIDEQHRFGVEQRKKISGKGDEVQPDLLVMSATPIPRTLALTLYGDLDTSVLKEIPGGRPKTKTAFLNSVQRGKAYGLLNREIRLGRQGYVVCPLIEDEQDQVMAVVRLFEKLRERYPAWKLGLLHGRLKNKEKEEIMAAYRDGQLDALVTTTVVEVGVDVPNATVMIIEEAERFGLAQLHQLRGRVGRGSHPAYCLLIGSPKNKEGVTRLEVMVREADGFAIAEEDLRLRGPGEFFGTKQHGLPDLKIADPLRDGAILEMAREEVSRVLADGGRTILSEVAEVEITS